VVAGHGDNIDDDITITSDEERELVDEIQDDDGMENMKDDTKWELELYQLVQSPCLWQISLVYHGLNFWIFTSSYLTLFLGDKKASFC